jgi:hypothetical protein
MVLSITSSFANYIDKKQMKLKQLYNDSACLNNLMLDKEDIKHEC